MVDFSKPSVWGKSDCIAWVLGPDAPRPDCLVNASSERRGLKLAVIKHGSLRKATLHHLRAAGYEPVTDGSLLVGDRVEYNSKLGYYTVAVITEGFEPMERSPFGLKVVHGWVLGTWRKK